MGLVASRLLSEKELRKQGRGGLSEPCDPTGELPQLAKHHIFIYIPVLLIIEIYFGKTTPITPS